MNGLKFKDEIGQPKPPMTTESAHRSNLIDYQQRKMNPPKFKRNENRSQKRNS